VAISNPMVSICVSTYQHVAYIEECLKGILKQQTTFRYEVLIGEDGSTDGTREICQEIKQKYPEKISLFLHDRKDVIYIDGRPSGRRNLMFNLGKARGKYIALCEGDDYWTDPLKLQKQVDILEGNPRFSMCFHNTWDNYNGQCQLRFAESMNNEFTTYDFLEQAIVRTLSLVYRNGLIKELPSWFKSAYMGDWPLVLMLSTFGNAFYINEAMGVYRVAGTGVWTGSKDLFRLKARYHLYQSMLSYLSEHYYDTIQLKLTLLYPAFFQHYLKSGSYKESIRFLKMFLNAPFKYQKAYLLRLVGHSIDICC